MTTARVELGRRLFYDARLSGNGTQSCATCHVQSLAFTDGRAHGLGSTGEEHPRSPMSLVNVAYRDTLTWAHPSLRSLEEQALVPMLGTSPIELGLQGHERRVYDIFATDPVYRPLFAAAFPGESAPVTTANVATALSAFERSIVSFRSPFDRYRELRGSRRDIRVGDARVGVVFFESQGALHQLSRGLNLDGGAKTTATPADEVPVFTFHNTGLYNLPGPFSYPRTTSGCMRTPGKLEDVGKFRVPTLRNIALTAPYMHDGSIATLDEVLDHYTAGGRTPNPESEHGAQAATLTRRGTAGPDCVSREPDRS